MLQKYLIYKILFLLIITPVYLIGNIIDFTKNINTTKISILTCDPGNEIYSLFGHSALRIKDTKNQIDMVVNWGLFEFSENQFEFGYDFAKGRLNYFMGLQSMTNFIYEYARSNRGVREQVLNLDEQEKLNLLSIISENYKPENRNYRYEFFYDNCSSRIRDLLIEVFKEKINFHKSPLADKNTFRETIHQYLKYDPWLELGIDLVLGKKIDILISNNNLMFLPEKIESILDKSQVENESVKKNIILTKSTIVNSNNQERTSENIIKYSWGIFFITLILLYLKQSHLIRVWSIMNLSVLGILGILLIFMWWGTDHQATKMNFNLLWASPLHFILIVNILKKKSGVFYYWFLVFSLIIIFSTVLFWFALIQDFNPFVKPLIIQLGLIYYYYFKKNKNQINLHKTSG